MNSDDGPGPPLRPCPLKRPRPPPDPAPAEHALNGGGGGGTRTDCREDRDAGATPSSALLALAKGDRTWSPRWLPSATTLGSRPRDGYTAESVDDRQARTVDDRDEDGKEEAGGQVSDARRRALGDGRARGKGRAAEPVGGADGGVDWSGDADRDGDGGGGGGREWTSGLRARLAPRRNPFGDPAHMGMGIDSWRSAPAMDRSGVEEGGGGERALYRRRPLGYGYREARDGSRLDTEAEDGQADEDAAAVGGGGGRRRRHADTAHDHSGRGRTELRVHFEDERGNGGERGAEGAVDDEEEEVRIGLLHRSPLLLSRQLPRFTRKSLVPNPILGAAGAHARLGLRGCEVGTESGSGRGLGAERGDGGRYMHYAVLLEGEDPPPRVAYPPPPLLLNALGRCTSARSLSTLSAGSRPLVRSAVGVGLRSAAGLVLDGGHTESEGGGYGSRGGSGFPVYMRDVLQQTRRWQHGTRSLEYELQRREVAEIVADERVEARAKVDTLHSIVETELCANARLELELDATRMELSNLRATFNSTLKRKSELIRDSNADKAALQRRIDLMTATNDRLQHQLSSLTPHYRAPAASSLDSPDFDLDPESSFSP